MVRPLPRHNAMTRFTRFLPCKADGHGGPIAADRDRSMALALRGGAGRSAPGHGNGPALVGEIVPGRADARVRAYCLERGRK